MSELIYTPLDGAALVELLAKNGIEAQLIGSLGRGENSTHDIDLFLPNSKLRKRRQLRGKLISILVPGAEIEETDWGGWFFHNSKFGNVDIFFSIRDFDY